MCSLKYQTAAKMSDRRKDVEHSHAVRGYKEIHKRILPTYAEINARCGRKDPNSAKGLNVLEFTLVREKTTITYT